MDPALYRPCIDVESACPGDDVRRKSYDRRFSRQHDRCGIRAEASRTWFLGLCALWYSDNGFDHDRRDFSAAPVALRNQRAATLQSHAGAEMALRSVRSI